MYLLLLLPPTALCMTVLGFAGESLKTKEAPAGILTFELAGLKTNDPQAILKGWDERARQWAAFGLGFDYCFIVFYSMFLTIACVWTAKHVQRELGFRLGITLAWLQIVAGLLDCVENAGLLVTLLSDGARNWMTAGAVASAGKWLLIFAGITYVVIGWLFVWTRKA
jgi:hypothetical protein